MAETTVLRSSAINRTPNRGAKPQAQLSGAHPVVQVNMNSGGPTVQGGQGTARQGVVLLPPKGGTRAFTTGGLPNQPAKQSVVISPPKDPRYAAAAAVQQVQQGHLVQQAQLSPDQLLLCRHLVDKYLDEVRARAVDNELPSADVDNVKLGEGAILAIDAAMAQLTAAAALVEAPPPAPQSPPRAVSVGGPRQVAAGAAPRRVVRPAPPPVTVKMDAGKPIIQDTPVQAAPPSPPEGAPSGMPSDIPQPQAPEDSAQG